jgi:hypothetical protein
MSNIEGYYYYTVAQRYERIKIKPYQHQKENS